MKGGPQGGQEAGFLNKRNEVGSKKAEGNLAGEAGRGQGSERLQLAETTLVLC